MPMIALKEGRKGTTGMLRNAWDSIARIFLRRRALSPEVVRRAQQAYEKEFPSQSVLEKRVSEAQAELVKIVDADILGMPERDREEAQEDLCGLTRRLLLDAPYASDYPEVWRDDRVQEILSLMERAAAATVGSRWEISCSQRPPAFSEAIESAREAREAWLDVERAQE